VFELVCLNLCVKVKWLKFGHVHRANFYTSENIKKIVGFV